MLSACEQGGGGRAVEDEASGNDRRRCVGDEDGLHEGGRREVDECSVIIWRNCFEPWDQR